MFLGIKVIFWLIALGAVIVIPIALAAALFAAAVLGSPGECDSGVRPVNVSTADAAAFQAKLDDLNDRLDAGQPGSFQFTESEAASRAVEFLDEHDAPIENLKICFNENEASASGTVDVRFGPNVDAKLTGTLDLTGESPNADVDIDVGKVPGFVTGAVEWLVERIADDQLVEIDLEEHDYRLEFAEGTATLSGTP
ncbi:MAG: hypothetical protein WBF66_09495 [Dehalococcoidia bacterium]